MIKRQKTFLIKDADYIVTMNNNREILRNYSILIEGNRIKKLTKKNVKADKVINASGMIVIPGFINCHHHMFQCGLRGNPKLQNQKIDKWIKIVCDYTKQIDEEVVYYSALANMAELLLYGCTTTTDMHYIFPKNKNGFFEATIRAAKDIGIRFHPYRGSMSLSKKNGSFFPDDVVEDSEAIALQSEEMIRRYHDSSSQSMLKIGMAPCTIFTSSKLDYENATFLSKRYKINLQTHLSESEFENNYSLKKLGRRPFKYLHDMGWVGEKVSFVHGINLNKEEIREIAKTKTNIIHCPISNARAPIGEKGIAPVWEMLEDKVNVAIGTDGSASNDSSNVLEELRWARTLQGIRKESTYLKPMQVLEIGTINGAKLLNWTDSIGSIEEKKAADISCFKIKNKIEHTGSIWDPITLLISTQAVRAEVVIDNGKVVVKNEKLEFFNEQEITDKLNKLIKKALN